MKKIATLFLLFVAGLTAKAQTFSSTTTAPIQDNVYSFIPISVSGLPTSIDTSFGLCTLCFDIVHTYCGDLDVILVSPAGDSIPLINNQGGGGDNYSGTCLTMSATVPITSAQAVAPFTGNYIPEASLNYFNLGQNPNGVWHLGVRDEAPQDTGMIVSASLQFCNNPPNNPIVPNGGPCGYYSAYNCMCPDSSFDCDLLPDMTASYDYILTDYNEQPGIIRVGNATPNIGWGPMEIRASSFCWCDTVPVNCTTSVCPNGGQPSQQLLQRIYHKSNGIITHYDTLTQGRMSNHPTHGHVHVNNWSEFTLRTQDLNDPDARNWPIVARGSKISFCLINLGNCTANNGWCRDSANNILTMDSIPNAPFGLVSGCGTEQGIYTGMLDIYSSGLPDMHIDLTGVCNGNYYIVSETDPDNNFIETNDNNNWVAVPMTLSLQSTPITSGFGLTQSGNATIVSNNNTDLISFEWDFGDGNTDTTNNPATHVYSNPGTYTITLTQVNGCGTFTSTQVITITGVGESPAFADQFLRISPNPSTGLVNLSGVLPQGGNVQLEIYNVVGERVITQQHQRAAGAYTLPLDMDALGLANGSYLIRLAAGDYQATQRVVLSR